MFYKKVFFNHIVHIGFHIVHIENRSILCVLCEILCVLCGKKLNKKTRLVGSHSTSRVSGILQLPLQYLHLIACQMARDDGGDGM